MATSIIRLHAFSGANENEPPCYLLQVDNFHCLLDCGWDSKFSDTYVQQVAKYTKLIDAVFISHSDVRHMGALPFLVGKCGLTCPIYMTGPVHQMGHLSLYDAYIAISESQDFTMFDLENVDAVFDLVVNMKFQQTKNLHGKGQGVSVTPYVAGHMIGGALWKIVKDDLEIVYAIDYNHKKENHLNGAMFTDIQRPHLLITSSYHSLHKMRKKNKEDLLKTTIHETLKRNGNILFLSDTAGRSLELAYLMEKMWRKQESGLMAYGLALVSNVAVNVMEFAQSNVEWLSDELSNGFEAGGWKPFQLKYTSICHDMKDVKAVPEPMVAVVSQSHLNYGYGKELLKKWCENENNLIVITTRDREECLSKELYKHAQKTHNQPETFSLSIKEESRSSNEDFLMKLTQESLFPIEQTLRSQSKLENKLEKVDEMSSDEEDSIKMEWDSGTEGAVTHLSKDLSCLQDENGISSDGTGFRLPGFDICIGQHANASGQYFRAAQRLSLVFPSQERKVQWDIYGEQIDVKDPNFLYTAGSSYAMNAMNQKLMWSDINKIQVNSEVSKRLYDSNNDMTAVREKIMNSFDTGKEIVAKTGSTKEFTVRCSVIFHEFEGLADVSAMQQMITHCKPQEVIIVGGSRQDSEAVAAFCRGSLHMRESLVHIPERGQVVNCTKEGHIYQVRMSDSLVSSLSFQKVGHYELAWLDAVVRMPAAPAANENGGGEEDALVEVNQIPTLELPQGPIPEHNTIFINEPKLSDLKQLLINRGMVAEFNGGVLIVDNCVAIKKTEAGKLLLEGTCCQTYFDVREVLYSQFAIL